MNEELRVLSSEDFDKYSDFTGITEEEYRSLQSDSEVKEE